MIFNKRFGPYRLVRKLATGGMAEVYLALKEGPAPFAKLVALKSILPHGARDETLVRMFYQEARLGALFRHPNLVHVFDAAPYDGRHTMVMEFVAGMTVREIAERMEQLGTRLAVNVAVEIASATALGLHAAHTLRGLDGEALQIVHRDVSPDNVLVGFDGTVKVFDFGVAVAADAEGTGQLAGKAAYMSPEQCRGRRIDARSDVFALGIVLHEMLTGQRLFKRENQLGSIRAITEEAIPNPSQQNDAVPMELDAIVMKALARSPDERFASALELHRALAAFLAQDDEEVGEEVISAFMLGEFRAEVSENEVVVQKILMAPAPSQTAVDLSAIGTEEAESRGPILASGAGSFDELGGPAPPSGSGPPPVDSVLQRQAVEALETRLGRARMTNLFLLVFLLVAGGAAAWFGMRGPEVVEVEDRAALTLALEVSGTPESARLLVDGEVVATSLPAEALLVEGEAYQIRVEADGYVAEERTLSVQRGTENRQLFELEIDEDSPDAPIGSVRVVFTPEDAVLHLDQERYTDGSPIEVDGLRLNREYMLRLQAPGYENLPLYFSVDSSDQLEIQLEMVEALELGKLHIESSPSGAAILVNGEEVGETPMRDLELPANQLYTVELRLAGHQRWRRAVQLAGESEIRADLQRVGAAAEPRPAPTRPTAPSRAAEDDRYELLLDP